MERRAYLKSYIFDEIHSNVPNFTIKPKTKKEQEIGFLSPFSKYNFIYTLTQRYSRK